MVPGAEFEAARGEDLLDWNDDDDANEYAEDLLDVILDVSDETGGKVCLLVQQLPQQGDQDQAQGLAERLVREHSDCLRDKYIVRQIVKVVEQSLVQKLEDHLEDVPDCCFFETDASCLRFEVGFR